VIDLSVADRQRLVLMLRDVPELATESSRRRLLELAGLDALAGNIDVSGSPFEAVSQIVVYLASYGRVSGGQQALGLFLNLLKEFVGPDRQQVLGDLLSRYRMMTPLAPGPTIGAWRGAPTADDFTEKIISSNTLRPISFITGAVAAARSVAYLEVRTPMASWSGSGFLVGPNLLLTNNHVLPERDLVADTVFRFNYQDDVHGRPEIHRDVRARSDGVFHTSQELDYSLVELDGHPGNDWGFLPLGPVPVLIGDRVNIIQHPGGQPKQIAMRDNLVEYVGGGVVQYVTSTMPGSSGSPVFTDSWQVCALHHAGGTLREPTTSRVFFRNEGIMVADILLSLPKSLRDLVRTRGTEAA
jgi:V8-like Glu-specific endopeptidase